MTDPTSRRSAPREIILRVAGFRFAVQGEQAIAALRTLGGFAKFVREDSEKGELLFTFRHTADCEGQTTGQTDTASPPVHRFQTEGITCVFSRTRQGGYSFRMQGCESPGQTFCWTYFPQEKHFAATGYLDSTFLRFALWQALNTALLPLGTTAVHSSVICAQGRSVLFLGESGTGKSTHTRLWQQHLPQVELLNDDSPFLQTVPAGTPQAWGSPWSGKTPCYHDLHYPIAGIVRLSQAPANRIRRLSVVEAVGALLPSLPPSFAYDPEMKSQLLNIVSRTLSAVPVYHLACRPEREAAILSYNTLFPHSAIPV